MTVWSGMRYTQTCSTEACMIITNSVFIIRLQKNYNRTILPQKSIPRIRPCYFSAVRALPFKTFQVKLSVRGLRLEGFGYGKRNDRTCTRLKRFLLQEDVNMLTSTG